MQSAVQTIGTLIATRISDEENAVSHDSNRKTVDIASITHHLDEVIRLLDESDSEALDVFEALKSELEPILSGETVRSLDKLIQRFEFAEAADQLRALRASVHK